MFWLKCVFWYHWLMLVELWNWCSYYLVIGGRTKVLWLCQVYLFENFGEKKLRPTYYVTANTYISRKLLGNSKNWSNNPSGFSLIAEYWWLLVMACFDNVTSSGFLNRFLKWQQITLHSKFLTKNDSSSRILNKTWLNSI